MTRLQGGALRGAFFVPGSVEDEKEIHAENDDVDGSLQHVGAALSEGEDGDRENNEEEGDLRVFQAEDDL